MLPISIILLLAAVLGVWSLVHALRQAPVGIEDETGFHAEASSIVHASAVPETPETTRPGGRLGKTTPLPRGHGTATAH